jgi:hypothetical protein
VALTAELCEQIGERHAQHFNELGLVQLLLRLLVLGAIGVYL